MPQNYQNGQWNNASPQNFGGASTNTMPYIPNYAGSTVANMPYIVPRQPSPAAPQNGIVGKVISKAEDIMPGDVPMDYTPAVFPLNDLSAIIVKQWGQDFQIHETIFVPVQTQTVESPTADTQGFIEAIDRRLTKIEKAVCRNNKKQPYKEVNSDESNG